MSDAPKLPKGLPVESFDPGDLVYTAKDMEDMHAQGVREGRAAAFAEAARVASDAGLLKMADALRARADSGGER